MRIETEQKIRQEAEEFARQEYEARLQRESEEKARLAEEVMLELRELFTVFILLDQILQNNEG